MHHYFNAITNAKGDALTGYYVKCVDPDTSDVVDIYADSAETPIVSVSGLANAAQVDSDGNVSFFVDVGTYHLDIYATDGTTLIRRISEIPMNLDEDTAALAQAALEEAQSTLVDVTNLAAEVEVNAAAAEAAQELVDLAVSGIPDIVSSVPNATAHAPNRGALATLDTSEGPAYLAESGREGMFVFDSSNLSSMIVADPEMALYVPPFSDTTGASGAWVRQFRGPLNVMWFGAVADNTTDTSDAFVAALALAKTLGLANHGYSHSATLGIFVPKGIYYLGSTTLDIRCSLIFEGETGSGPAGGSSTLRWDDGVPGIRLQAWNTDGATGEQTGDLADSATGTIIRNLRLEGGRSGTADDEVSFGIHMRAPCTIRDVMIQGFGSNGVQMNATADGSPETIPEGNCNCFLLDRLWIEGCYNGIYVAGADSNAGTGRDISCVSNHNWGIYDSSFLGNSWLGGHSASNTAGPFWAQGENTYSVFLGIYVEGDQPAAEVRSPSIVIGGHQGAGVESNGSTATRPWLSSIYDGLHAKGNLFVDGSAVATSLVSNGSVGFQAAVGAGGTVTQATSKSTGVTLNKNVGKITMHNAALAASTSVSFTLTNSQIAARDFVTAQIVAGATANSYIVQVDEVGAGSCRIQLRNISGGSLGEAVEIRFVVIKGSND